MSDICCHDIKHFMFSACNSCSSHVVVILIVSFDIFIKRPKLTLSLADEASAQAPATLPVEGIK